MAYLNVRERRLETKIAYLGPALSGRATNFDQLGGGELGGDVLALYWKPRETTTFRDCDVRVQLVTSRGEASDEQVIGLLRDADGVVFVADADPDAQDRNRQSLARVREALSLQNGRDVPVVVQLNKVDLPDAVSAESVAKLLDLGAWPCVNASAASGRGVVETLERALDVVLEALRKDPSDDLSGPGAQTVRPAATRALPREGNPLLTALRQVLRETVMAEVDELERRIADRLDRAATQVVDPRGPSDDHGPLLRQLVDDTSKIRAALEAAREQNERLEVTTTAATAALSSLLQKLGTDVSSQRSELTALRERIAGIDTRTAALPSVAEAVDRHSAQLSAVTETIGLLELTIHASTTEVNRALVAASTADQERLTASTTQLRRAVDGVVHEMKATDIRPTLSAMKAVLDSTVKPVAAVAPRLEQLESVVQRELRDGLRAVAAKVAAAHQEAAVSTAAAEAKSADLHALLEAVIEELKKPKKSWFT